MARQIVLDTETTGLSPQQGHRIIEIGCVELLNRQLTGDSRHWYIDPERDIDAGAQKVHGITRQSLQGKPKFSAIVQDLLNYIQDAELVIHNAPFDIGFLDHELRLAGKQYGQISDYATVLDTLLLARAQHPGQRNSLDALCVRYQVDLSKRERHGALLDSELLAQVYLLMTGGQTQLFATEQVATQGATQVAIKRAEATRPRLPVIEPTAKEMTAHQEWVRAQESE